MALKFIALIKHNLLTAKKFPEVSALLNETRMSDKLSLHFWQLSKKYYLCSSTLFIEIWDMCIKVMSFAEHRIRLMYKKKLIFFAFSVYSLIKSIVVYAFWETYGSLMLEKMHVYFMVFLLSALKYVFPLQIDSFFLHTFHFLHSMWI